jgi:hypothetical protein
MTTLRKGDYARALGLAEKFNIKAGARPVRRVKATLSQAIAFLDGLKTDLKNGAEISVGSAWTGPDPFLDKDIVKQLARKTDRTDYLTGTVDVPLTKRDEQKLSSLRRAFKLSSDKQAAGLAVRVYDAVCDNLWRGNGFSVETKGGVAASLKLDAEMAVVRQYQPATRPNNGTQGP